MTQDGSEGFTHYEQALAYLCGLAAFGIKPGLERMEALLALMGHPERKTETLRFVHIGGTNGKGSTLAVMEALLSEHGWQVGCYISPHLHDWRERICLGGEPISEEDVLRGVNFIRPLAASLARQGLEHPTEFEVATALAFWYFAETLPDVVLLEVGLGGAIDSTNVIDPEIVVLTRIGMDHMDYLGTTLAQIAEVKAGIIKKGVPVVASAQRDEVLRVIENTCRLQEAPLIYVEASAEKAGGEDHESGWMGSAELAVVRSGSVQAGMKPSAHPERTSCFDYYGMGYQMADCEVSLAGDHQTLNASTALAAVEVLLKQKKLPSSDFSPKKARRALGKVSWPGRAELLFCTLPDRTVRVLLDGAHNTDGIWALRRVLERGFPRKRLIFCFGMLADKEVEEALKVLLPLGDEFVVTCPASARSGNWKKIADFIRTAGSPCFEEENIAQAVKRALEMCGKEDVLCITGSLYLLAGARSFILGLTAGTAECMKVYETGDA